MDTKVAVGETNYGRAVFADRSFNAGERIARITGDIFADDEHESQYCIDLEDGTVLEPTEPFRYLNHCCDPNCELIIHEMHDQPPQVWFYVLKPVESGDELTIDYGWEAEAAIPCLCNSSSCRGWIVDERQLDAVQRTSFA